MSNFHMPVRVYIEDTDAGGIVFYANYLKYMERARTEWLRTLGIGLAERQQNGRILFVVRSVGIDYKAPACLDDLLSVTVALEQLGRAKIVLQQQVLRDTKILTEATITLACIDADTRFVKAIPHSISEAISVEH